jgi:hypothetical protein
LIDILETLPFLDGLLTSLAVLQYIYLKIPGELKVVDQETGNHALQLSAAMATYWTNFAATGDPNQKDRFHQAAGT